MSRILPNGIILPKYFDSERDESRLCCSHLVSIRSNNPLNPPDIARFNWFLGLISDLRERVGFPLIINSGWRSLEHPVEAKKKPGANHAHYDGPAVDLHADGHQAHEILDAAFSMKCFRGIGAKEHGPLSGRLIHLDVLNTRKEPVFWTYP